MFPGDVRHFLTARHSRQFLDPKAPHDLFDMGPRASATRFLANHEVPIREGGDLREMRNAQDLMLRGQLRQDPAHAFRDRPANSGIDLVEDDHHVAVCPAQ